MTARCHLHELSDGSRRAFRDALCHMKEHLSRRRRFDRDGVLTGISGIVNRRSGFGHLSMQTRAKAKVLLLFQHQHCGRGPLPFRKRHRRRQKPRRLTPQVRSAFRRWFILHECLCRMQIRSGQKWRDLDVHQGRRLKWCPDFGQNRAES